MNDRGRYCRKKHPWAIFEEQFPVPRNTAASKIGNSVISLLWQLRCHNKFSPLSDTTVVAVFPNLCLWRLSLCSKLGGINPKKSSRATLMTGFFWLLVALVIDVKQKNSIALESKVQWQDSLGAKSKSVGGQLLIFAGNELSGVCSQVCYDFKINDFIVLLRVENATFRNGCDLILRQLINAPICARE